MTRRPTLLVIAKSPIPGRVKTRLCPPCTPEEAAHLAEAALADTLETLAAVPARRHVVALDGPPGPWLPSRYCVIPQVGDGLAARLGHALSQVRGPAFLVGMDTPQLDGNTVADALETLAHADAVLGPAVDGGWWGIGLRRPDARVFDGVEMSTEHTHREQLDRLHALGLRTRALRPLRDVDTFPDALSVAAEAPSTRFARAVAELPSHVHASTAAR
jgi:rSAM/selenodomain-associated transferase 1